MSEKLSRLIRLLGSTLAVIAIVLIVRSIWMQRAAILGNISYVQVAIIILGGMFIYIFGNFLLASAWNTLLQWQGVTQASSGTIIGIYGQTQILKYIPGNFLSLPGRHLVGRRYGISHGSLVGAAAFEIVGLLAAASLVSVAGILLTQDENMSFTLPFALAVLFITIVSPLIIKSLYRHLPFFQRLPVFQAITDGNYLKLIFAWFLYIGFFLLTGLILLWTMSSIGSTWHNIPITMIFSVYAISWFTGFITPGAPAGAGVREGILVLLLTGYIGEPKSILASILLRFATMLGDVAFYFISLLPLQKVWIEKNKPTN